MPDIIPERVRKLERILYGDKDTKEIGLIEQVKNSRDKIITMQIKVAGIGAGVSIITTIVILLLTNLLRK